MFKFHRWVLFFFIFTLLLPGSRSLLPASNPPAAPELAGKLARFEQQLERLRRLLKVPGMSAAIVKDHKVLWTNGFGYADLENKIKATENTPYRLGSVTKIFTATILMRLVEAGKLDLDDPLADYGVHIKSPGIITLRHILNHTSEGMPGSHFKYNGLRFASLGTPIKKAAGKPFRKILIDDIIKPLGLTHTAPYPSPTDRFYKSLGFCQKEKDLDHVFNELAKPYTLDSSLNIVPGAYIGSFNPGAGLMSSALDLAKFNIAIDTNFFLKKETQEMGWTTPLSTGGEPLPYGSGWFIRQYMGHRFITHYGEWECVAVLVVKAPEQNMTFVVLGNSRNLNRFFSVYYCDPQEHLAGLLFLKIFILEFMEKVPDIDWEGQEDEIVKQLEAFSDSRIKEILQTELILNYNLFGRFREREKRARLLNVYDRVFSSPVSPDFNPQTVIAEIKDVEDSQHRAVEFSLDKDETFCVYAIGEGTQRRMVDYGYIENTATGEMVWEMRVADTVPAGGAFKNLKVNRVISLPAGHYRLHYLTDDSHAINRWNDLPPTHRFWGIMLYHDPVFEEKNAPGDHQPVENTPGPAEIKPEPFRSTWQVIFWAYHELLFLSALAFLPGYGIRRFRYWKLKKAYTPADARLAAKSARFMAFFTGLAYFYLKPVLIGIKIDQGQGLIENYDCFALFGGNNSLVWQGMLLLMAVLLVFTGLAWKNGYWDLKRRLHFTAVALAAILVVLSTY
jgi:CubicO group peptidase (beta-lactamase class C family)